LQCSDLDGYRQGYNFFKTIASAGKVILPAVGKGSYSCLFINRGQVTFCCNYEYYIHVFSYEQKETSQLYCDKVSHFYLIFLSWKNATLNNQYFNPANLNNRYGTRI
jgi:hypothetical protein